MKIKVTDSTRSSMVMLSLVMLSLLWNCGKNIVGWR